MCLLFLHTYNRKGREVKRNLICMSGDYRRLKSKGRDILRSKIDWKSRLPAALKVRLIEALPQIRRIVAGEYLTLSYRPVFFYPGKFPKLRQNHFLHSLCGNKYHNSRQRPLSRFSLTTAADHCSRSLQQIIRRRLSRQPTYHFPSIVSLSLR